MPASNDVRRSSLVLASWMCWLAAAAFAVGDREAVYYGGDVSPAYLRGDTKSFPRRYYGTHAVSGRLDTSSDSELIFDAGSRGSLVIPWAAILALDYGTGFGPGQVSYSPDGSAAAFKREARAYPWSEWSHFSDHYYLVMLLRDERGRPGDVIFELGKDIVQPTLAMLQRRTGRDVTVSSLGACVAYKGREGCGWGFPSELKGRTSVFIDTAGSDESKEGEFYRRILAVIEKAGVGVTVVKTAKDADVILAFHYEQGAWASQTQGPSRAVGDVYVTDGGKLRVLLFFAEEARLWNRTLAENFGQKFVRAYRDANRIR